MFKLSDFNTLPQLEPFFQRMVAEGPGLIVLGGIETQFPNAQSVEAFPSSGISAVFDVLVYTMLAANPDAKACAVARERVNARVPRRFSRQVKALIIEGNHTYEQRIAQAASLRPALLVIDHLTAESAPAAFSAAARGAKVLAACDTPLRGAALARHMLSLGVSPDDLQSLTWLLSLQRLPALCPACREPCQPRPAEVRRIARLCPSLAERLDDLDRPPTVWRAPGCDRCHRTGRSGDVAVFDVFQARSSHPGGSPLDLDSVLPAEEYIFQLVLQGALSLDDLHWFEADRLQRAYQMLSAGSQALDEASSTLRSKLYELRASNRVLLQRTEALLSLEDLGRALIESADLADLAGRICRRAGMLCGADRAIFYLLQNDRAEILASHGWEEYQAEPNLQTAQIFEGNPTRQPAAFTRLPPGLRPPAGSPEPPIPTLLSGLRVPLLAQEQLVGAMIIQSCQNRTFTPGETALLQTFANQAALAIQRAGLVEDLREKIAELETAQAGLMQKERMQRELELAREVQQRLLPRSFPSLAGFTIAAHSEPARHVGGDFYDLIPLDPDHFGLVIADVADKGMPAALYMALTRSLLQAEARRELSPRRALENVNRLLLELGELDGFVSVFYGVVQMSTRILTYARAGHEKPWLLGPAGELMPLSGEGMVLGVTDADLLHLSEETWRLARGDRLVLYTDGLTDTAGPSGEFFGAARLEDHLRRCAAAPAGTILTDLLAALEQFRGQTEPFDDLTLLVLEVE